MEKNRNVIVKCGNCGNEAVLVDKIDTFSTQIQIIAARDFSLQINCEVCENSIEAE